MTAPSTKENVVALSGRILLSLIFILSAVAKMGSPVPTQAVIESAGLPFPMLAYFGAVVLELVGGILLVVGFQTRWAAAALAIFTVVAGALFHNNFGDQNDFIHFLKNVAITGGLIQVAIFGAGAISLDARRGAYRPFGPTVPVR